MGEKRSLGRFAQEGPYLLALHIKQIFTFSSCNYLAVVNQAGVIGYPSRLADVMCNQDYGILLAQGHD